MNVQKLDYILLTLVDSQKSKKDRLIVKKLRKIGFKLTFLSLEDCYAINLFY